MAVLAVLLTFILLGCGTVLAADINDIGGHWAAAEIERAISSGYVKGYPDGTFRPDTGVTRAEFVAMLDSAFQVPAGQNENTPGDVSDQDWFAQDVKSALAAGFVSGYPDGTFRPQDEVSRQDGACMLAKLLNLDGAGDPSFSDADEIGGWAKASVSGLVAAGIMAGYPDGSFRPQEVITRAEAVVMINKALASQSPTPVTDQLQVTGDAVNVRSGPSTSAQIIGQANSGDILQAEAENDDDWYQIDYQGGSGWVAGWYVQVYQPSQVTNSPQASNSTVSDSTGNAPAEPDGANLASPDVQVGRNDAGSAVNIQGTQTSTQHAGKTGPQAPGDQAANPNMGTSTPAGSSTSGNGASFYGMDLAAYPGDDVMQAWWNDSPFYYTGFYLGPAPYHPDTSFMDKRQVLVDQGWGLLPVYVGRQADSWNLDQGVEDGDDAVNLAASAGFPDNTVIFLDIETSLPLTNSFLSYVTDWVSEVQSQGYIAGIYCYIGNASQIRNALPDNVQFWVAYYTGSDLPSSIPSPVDSGVSFASTWQFVGDTCLTCGGFTLDIDFNTSTYTDPSAESVNVKK